MSAKRRAHASPTRTTPVRAARRSIPPIVWLLPALIVVTFVAYHPAWYGGHLWDDDAHVTRPELQSLAGLWQIWFHLGATQQYYPVVHTAFWVLHRFFGDTTPGYHWLNITLHAVSAWFVAIILRRLRVPGAVLAAVIFALHPVQVESVAWITELKNDLSGLLYLAAMLAYLQFDTARTRLPYVLSLALFVLAVFTKSVTVTLPAALLIVIWWQRGRIDWRRDAVPLSPFVAVGLPAGLFLGWVERAYVGASGADFRFTLVERCLIAGRAIWFYLGKLVWPVDLIFLYPRWNVSQAVWWQYLFPLAALALLAVCWRLRARSRAPLAAFLFFVVTLGPALGFVNVYPFRFSFVADHFQYLACLGAIAMVSAGAALVCRRFAISPRAAGIGIVGIALLLGALTWRQCREYADAETLYRTTFALNPACWLAANNLGSLEEQESPPRDADAVRLLTAALTLRVVDPAVMREDPGVALEEATTHDNLGIALEGVGRLGDAAREYRAAVQLAPDDAAKQIHLTSVLWKMGEPTEAVAAFGAAVSVNPASADLHKNYGTTLLQLGRTELAIAEFRQAETLAPNDANTHMRLGTALETAGRLTEAEDEAVTVVKLNPSAEAYINLARLDLHLARSEDAAANVAAALRLEPEYGPAHYLVANILRQSDRAADAVVHFDIAMKDPAIASLPEAHNDYGVALASLGRVGDAVEQFRESLRLKPDFDVARENLARALASHGRGR